MMRALIVSAAQDQGLLGDALATSLVPRILAYARHHLTEDDLAPARIAADHNISVRYLYKLLEKEGISLEQWIIERRIEGARTDLASPAGRGLWVPTMSSLPATCEYSWIRPPSRSRRGTRMLSPAGTTWDLPSGGLWPRARCGRWVL
jgi:AraC-like DNA-binding protein